VPASNLGVAIAQNVDAPITREWRTGERVANAADALDNLLPVAASTTCMMPLSFDYAAGT
jgi:hypothetical protein